jgi:hypothetical protein
MLQLISLFKENGFVTFTSPAMVDFMVDLELEEVVTKQLL